MHSNWFPPTRSLHSRRGAWVWGELHVAARSNFFPSSEHLSEGAANLTQRGAGANTVEDEGHGVGRGYAVRCRLRLLPSRAPQGVEGTLDRFSGSVRAQLFQFRCLRVAHAFFDVQGSRRRFVDRILIHADDDLL